jgi:hypothetical protein
MSTPFPTNVNIISNGEAVNATVTNRPLLDLTNRTQSNKEKIDNGLFGTALIAFDVPLDSDSKVGQAVYVGSNGAYHKALAAVATDTTSDFQLADTSFAAGLILRKNTATSGDVVLQGVCTIASSDLNAVSLSGNLSAGQQIYLGGDNTKAGWITATRPLIHVPLASIHGPNTDGTFTVVVAPAPRPDLHNHVHYRVPLTMVNAGNTTTTQGWLNATADNFPGKTIPVGAVYGYNIAQDATLAPLWPPVPLHSVYLERNGKGVRTTGNSGEIICQIDSSGIWWMTNCVSDQPFGQAAINDGSGCPSYPDRLDLWLSKITSVTADPIVRSLTPADNSIILKNANGANATSGDLYIRSVLPVTQSSTYPGYVVAKEIGSSSGSAYVKMGPVVEGVRSTNGALVVTGSTTLTGTDPVSHDTQTFQGGLLHIDFTPPNSNLEGGMTSLVFDNTEEGIVSNIPMHFMRVGKSATIRGMLRVPTIGVNTPSNLTFKFVFYATANGTFPNLVVSRRIIRPAASCVNTALPTSDTALDTLDFTSCPSTAGNYFTKSTTTTLSVNPGDLVYVVLTRSASDGYAGDIGILDVTWSLS